MTSIIIRALLLFVTTGVAAFTSPRPRVIKTDEEWRSILSPEAYLVLRRKDTERPFSSPFNYLQESHGTFLCAGCGQPLFRISDKYDSGTGWPSFSSPITSKSIHYEVDYKLVLPRTECLCSDCGGHLGHVFEDGPAPTGLRYCMNGVAMTFSHDTISVEEPNAARLPMAAIFPGIAFNLAIACLFLLTYSYHPVKSFQQGALGYFPIPFAIFHLYNAAKIILRANQ